MKKVKFSVWGKALALVICLSLSLGIFSPLSAFAAGDKVSDIDKNRDGVVNYVVIGSYDAAGFGLAGYDADKFGFATAPDGSYADLVKEKIESTGKRVNMTQLSISGMRAEELRYLLDSDYAGDSYTEENFLGDYGVFAKLGGVEALRDKYASAIKSAEVITLDIGFDNFASYALAYMFENEYEANFTVFDDGMQRSINEIKSRFESVLGSYVADSGDGEIGEFLDRVINGLAYALVGYCHNFDKALGEIYAMNPDVTVAVTDVRNPVCGLSATMEGLAFPISLELIYGLIVDTANVYTATLTEYKDMFSFAYLGSKGMSLDEIKAYSGNPESISGDLAARLDASLGAGLSGLADDKRLAVRDAMMRLLAGAVGFEKLDLAAAANGKGSFNKVEAILSYAAENGLFNSADYNALLNDKAAMSHLAATVRYELGAVSLLDRAGHTDMANKIFNAISEGRVGSVVIAEDMNSIYSSLAGYFNRDALLDLEYTFKPYYTADKNSYYVALGDGSVAGSDAYPERLANELTKYPGFTKDLYKNFANLNKPESESNSTAKYDETPDHTLQAIKNGGAIREAVKKADLITLSYTNIQTLRNTLDKNYSTDWSSLLGSEYEDLVGQAFELLRGWIGDKGIDESIMSLVEKYAYAYMKRAIGYVELVEYIHQINPEALVVIVGTYNEMEGITFNFMGKSIPLGGVMQYLVDAANLETLAYSAITENTAYIAAPKGVQTVYNGSKEIEYSLKGIAKLTELIDKSTPSSVGHKAIFDAIINETDPRLVIVGEHGCEYDDPCDTRCNVCMAKRDVEHAYDGVCDAKCNLCGALRKAEPHKYDADCDTECNVCGEAREAAPHTYAADCDASCDLCGKTRETSVAHSFGEWTNTKDGKVRKCENCGYTEQGSGLSVGAIVAISVGGAVALGGCGFAIIWFAIKKKSLADLLALFSKK